MEIRVIPLAGNTVHVAETLQKWYGLRYRLIGTYESKTQVGGNAEGWCAILQKD